MAASFHNILAMTTHRDEKAKNAGISLYPWEIDKLRAFAAEHAGGNVSALIRSALAAVGLDLEAAATAQRPAGPIVALAQRHAPAQADTLAEHLNNTQQAATLARWLHEAAEVLSLGVPVEAVHLAGEHEIAAAPVALHARRYVPRLPRARWVGDSSSPYLEPAPRDVSANESFEPLPAMPHKLHARK